MDNSDGVEGFMCDKQGVAFRSPGDLLQGAPYRVSANAQASKEQVVMQAHGDMSFYHDLPGATTTTLSMDVQASGAPGGYRGLRVEGVLNSASFGYGLSYMQDAVASLLDVRRPGGQATAPASVCIWFKSVVKQW